MFCHLFMYALLAHTIWATPLPQQPHAVGEIASHIVIVTPQAQVHLEPGLKYETPVIPFIQHLAPLARFATPAHEETIVYYPASAAAAGPIIPIDAASVGRAESGQSKQWYEQIQEAVQQGTSVVQVPPQLTEAAAAAAAAASAASSAGANLFPALWPVPAAGGSQAKDEEKKPEQTPAATQALIPEARRFYAVPQIIDFVHAPVLVHPVQAIRARSIENPELAVALPIPEAAKPEALPLKSADLIDEKIIPTDEEKKDEEKARFLEAENPPKELEQQPAESEQKFEQIIKSEPLKSEEPAPAPAPAQLKSVAVVEVDEVPQSKVA